MSRGATHDPRPSGSDSTVQLELCLLVIQQEVEQDSGGGRGRGGDGSRMNRWESSHAKMKYGGRVLFRGCPPRRLAPLRSNPAIAPRRTGTWCRRQAGGGDRPVEETGPVEDTGPVEETGRWRRQAGGGDRPVEDTGPVEETGRWRRQAGGGGQDRWRRQADEEITEQRWAAESKTSICKRFHHSSTERGRQSEATGNCFDELPVFNSTAPRSFFTLLWRRLGNVWCW